LFVIVVTAPVPPNINSIVVVVERPSLFRLSGTRSSSKPTLILILAAKLKLFIRGIFVAAESATKPAFVVAEVQACFAKLDFRRRSERLKLSRLFRE
jgi:hypothetical protein